ncbi:hypothetical protein Taro_051182 [Colocasia esculenta]|uniref:Uncharacterized protein n=1 Tax=Colocasia esculenta TaxID=4460 RepID=A0A843XG69_COLES|nr:hypothetical protein [Colocasia esculenta]
MCSWSWRTGQAEAVRGGDGSWAVRDGCCGGGKRIWGVYGWRWRKRSWPCEVVQSSCEEAGAAGSARCVRSSRLVELMRPEHVRMELWRVWNSCVWKNPGAYLRNPKIGGLLLLFFCEIGEIDSGVFFFLSSVRDWGFEFWIRGLLFLLCYVEDSRAAVSSFPFREIGEFDSFLSSEGVWEGDSVQEAPGGSQEFDVASDISLFDLFFIPRTINSELELAFVRNFQFWIEHSESLEKVNILICAKNSRQKKCTVNNAAFILAPLPGRFAQKWNMEIGLDI